jgi:putative oxidoreductase
MKNIFSPSPLWQNQGVAIIRIITGLFLVYHGSEVFDRIKMLEYGSWDLFKNTFSGSFLVYTGKSAELVAGFLLVLGFVTRVASIIVIITFIYISFFVGHGKIWYDDQYPFLFVLLALVFFVTGPGWWSIDQLLFTRSKKINKKYPC